MTTIDIVSGFLGAGKTTFANMLLSHYISAGLRPVFIVNEFGEIGLDANIIKANGFTAVEMQGGCICCTLKGNVTSAIMQVMDTFHPTNIVFEPSGIFIFDDFIEILRSQPIIDTCTVGSVITIVDSVNFNAANILYGSFLYNQIKNAPAIILSKLEKTRQNVDEMICSIKNINPNATIFAKPWSDWNDADFAALTDNYKEPQSLYKTHHHTELKSVTIENPKHFTASDMDELQSYCGNGQFGDICRVKGVVYVDGEQMLINMAMEDFTLTPWNSFIETALTFMGKEIHECEILRFAQVGEG